MNTRASQSVLAADGDPREVAAELAAAHEDTPGWLDTFAEQLDRHRAGLSLARVLDVWGLSQSQMARYFDVSRQAIGKWLQHGIPAERVEAVADLAAATDLLVRYLKRDRIAAVVRRKSASMDKVSLIELLAQGRTREILAACRAMFAFDRAQG